MGPAGLNVEVFFSSGTGSGTVSCLSFIPDAISGGGSATDDQTGAREPIYLDEPTNPDSNGLPASGWQVASTDPEADITVVVFCSQ